MKKENDLLDKALVQSMGCQFFLKKDDPKRESQKKCECKTLFKDSSYCEEHYYNIYAKNTGYRARPKEQAARLAKNSVLDEIMDEVEKLEEQKELNFN